MFAQAAAAHTRFEALKGGAAANRCCEFVALTSLLGSRHLEVDAWKSMLGSRCLEVGAWKSFAGRLPRLDAGIADRAGQIVSMRFICARRRRTC
jgi:hypothetical protein